MHRRLTIFAVPAVALALTAGVTTAHASGAIGTTNVYVSVHGSDSNPCTKALPCATLQFAVDNAPAGSIIHVGVGTFNQSVNITNPVTIVGSGASKTIIDGSNIDTQAKSPAYFGVISVENNTGTGGVITIKGLTVRNAFITPTEYGQDSDPTDIIVYNDANTGDTVNVSGVALGAVQNAADFQGVGFDTLNDAATVNFNHSSVSGTFQGALLEGGGIGGSVTVTNVVFKNLLACAASTCGGGETFPAEGLFVLSDQPGTSTDTINNNKFMGYAGFGLAANAGYTGGNCAPPIGPCTGNVSLTANTNRFTLAACASASDGCAAIALDAQSGNELTAHIQGNKGTVHSPDGAIVEQADSGVYNVTEINNHIHVV